MDKKKLTDIVMDSVTGARKICDGKYSIIEESTKRAREIVDESIAKEDAKPKEKIYSIPKQNYLPAAKWEKSACIDKQASFLYLNTIKKYYTPRKWERNNAAYGAHNDEFLPLIKSHLLEVHTPCPIEATSKSMMSSQAINEIRRTRNYSAIGALGAGILTAAAGNPPLIVIPLVFAAASGLVSMASQAMLWKAEKMAKGIAAVCNESYETDKELECVGLDEIAGVLDDNKEKIMGMIR